MEGFYDTFNLLLLEHREWQQIRDGHVFLSIANQDEVPVQEILQRQGSTSSATEEDSMHARTIDIAAEFAQRDLIVLEPSEHLPCGLHFEQPKTLSQAECMALHSAVDAYQTMDGGPLPTTRDIYLPKMVGLHTGPDLGVLKTGEVWYYSKNPLLPCLKNGRPESNVTYQPPFQQQSNILMHQEGHEPQGAFDIFWAILVETILGYVAYAATFNIYQVMHSVAMPWHLPSQAEDRLWTTACILPNLETTVLFIIHSIGNRSIRKTVFPILYFLFILARLFLVIESFISIRNVPIGVYLVPGWLQMIPHL